MMDINDMRYMSFIAAAREIARRPHEDDEGICASHGIPLDSMTDDEIHMLETMIQDYMY